MSTSTSRAGPLTDDSMMKAMPEPRETLPYLMPVLVARIGTVVSPSPYDDCLLAGTPEITETGEEVRKLLVAILMQAIDTQEVQYSTKSDVMPCPSMLRAASLCTHAHSRALSCTWTMPSASSDEPLSTLTPM